MLAGCCLRSVAGSLVYCVLVIVAARRYLARAAFCLCGTPTPISVLKPLAGLDEGLESNLRTFFAQEYPLVSRLLFAVRHEDDPAVPVVRELQAEYPQVPSRLLLVGEPPYPNAKVWSLHHMTEAAQSRCAGHVRQRHPCNARISFARWPRSFRIRKLGVSTCPYRAVPGRQLLVDVWKRSG